MDADEVAGNIMRVREAVAAYNAGDVVSYANLYADPVTAVDTVTGDRTEVSRADGIAEAKGFRDAFSDHVCTIRQLTAQGDNGVVVEVAAVNDLHALVRQLGYQYHLPSSDDQSEG